MKKLTLLFAVLLIISSLHAQQMDAIDIKVAQYPNSLNNPEELAALINNDFDTDLDKARAIYSWIALNVKYDVKAHFAKKKKRKRLKYKDKIDRAKKLREREVKLENKAFNEHKALAQGYTLLYKRLCDLTGIYGYIIKGTAKVKTFDIGKAPRMLNHSWNMVRIDEEWCMVDAAFGAGVIDYENKTYQHNFNNKYFNTPPEKFFYNHFPREKGWLLVEKTADDFARLPLFTGEYLKKEFGLIEPANGILNLSGQDTIQFKINSPTSVENLSYQYSSEEDPIDVEVEQVDGIYVFSIPVAIKRSRYLSLFCDDKAIISYKIEAY